MAKSIFSVLKEKFPSKKEKIRKLEALREQLCGTAAEKKVFKSLSDEAYRDGVWDGLNQAIMLVKEGEL